MNIYPVWRFFVYVELTISEYVLLVVTYRCFSGSIKTGCCFSAIGIHNILPEAIGIKTLRGLLHDIGISFVQERVLPGYHMRPE